MSMRHRAPDCEVIELDMVQDRQPAPPSEEHDDIHPAERENVPVKSRLFEVMRCLAGFGTHVTGGWVEGFLRQTLLFFGVVVSIMFPPREPLFEWWVPMILVTSYAMWMLRSTAPTKIKTKEIVDTVIRRSSSSGAQTPAPRQQAPSEADRREEREGRRWRLLLKTVSFHIGLPEGCRRIYSVMRWPIALLVFMFTVATASQVTSRYAQWAAEGMEWWKMLVFSIEQLSYVQAMAINLSALCFLLYLYAQLQTEVRSLYMEMKHGLYETPQEYIKHHSSITKRIMKQQACSTPLLFIVVSGNLMRVIQSLMVLYVFEEGWAIIPMVGHMLVALAPALAASEVNAWAGSIISAAYRSRRFSAEDLDLIRSYEEVNPLSVYILGIRVTYGGFLNLLTSVISIGIPAVYASLRNSMPSFIGIIRERYGT